MVGRTDRKNVQKAARGLGREGEVRGGSSCRFSLARFFRSFTLTEGLEQAIQRVTQLFCLMRSYLLNSDLFSE